MRHSFLLIVMISVSLEPKWRHFAQVNIADIFMLSSKLPKQNEIMTSKYGTVNLKKEEKKTLKKLHDHALEFEKGSTQNQLKDVIQSCDRDALRH